LDASGLTPKESVPASRKLGREDAIDLAKSANKVIVAKGKKVDQFPIKGTPTDEVIGAMLGPTGNLRAPTMRVGKTIVVGFNEEQYQTVLKL
tara:strand:- start:198 stop:473 length:276 start_codon:yes stop_codon:yes gene_type:complete